MTKSDADRVWVRLRMNMGRWIEAGYSNRDIQDGLDILVIKAGRRVYDFWKINHGRFKLFKSWYTTLHECYGIFKNHGHLPEITKELAEDMDAVWKEWTIDFDGAKRSVLLKCVLVLNLFAEIEINGKDFVVKKS